MNCKHIIKSSERRQIKKAISYMNTFIGRSGKDKTIDKYPRPICVTNKISDVE
jgi:hypothetical protein